MIEKRTKILLIIFIISILFFLGSMFSSSFLNNINGINSKIEVYETNLKKITESVLDKKWLNKRIKYLEDEYNNELSAIFRKDEINVYSFGLLLQDIFKNNNVTIIKYNTVKNQKLTTIEFIASSKPLNFVNLLNSISTYKKNLIISLLNVKINEKTNVVDIVIRISYESI